MSVVNGSGDGATAPWRVDRFHPPFPYEFGDGYVVRVACEDRKDSAFQISSLGGVAFANKPDLFLSHRDGLAVVADCMRVPLAELQVRSMPIVDADGLCRLFWGTSLDKREIETKRRLFCPETLRTDTYTRSSWQLRAFPFCESSGRVLTDRCHRCGGIQRFVRAVGIENCDKCLTDLRRGTTPPVPAEDLDDLRVAVGLVHPDPARRAASLARLPDELRVLGSADVYVLLTFLARLVEPELPPVEQVMDVDFDARLRRLSAMARAWRLMAGWPSAVTALMDARMRTSTVRHGDGMDGASLHFFHSADFRRTPHPVARLLRGLKASVSLDRPEGAAFAASTIGFKPAAKLLRCSTDELPGCRRRGLLKVRLGFNKRCVALYDRTEIEGIAAVLRSWKPLSRHAWALRIPPYAMEQIAALGLTEVERHPFLLDRYPEFGVTDANFARLLERIAARATDLQGPTETLARALLAPGGGLRPWGPGFELLLEGSIRYRLVPGTKLGSRILVHREDVPRIRALTFDQADFPDARFSSTISLDAATEVLDLGWNDASALLGETRGDALSVTDVVDIARRHIGAAEIGRRLGLGERQGIAVRRWVAATGVARCGPGTWPRDEIMRRLKSAPPCSKFSQSDQFPVRTNLSDRDPPCLGSRLHCASPGDVERQRDVGRCGLNCPVVAASERVSPPSPVRGDVHQTNVERRKCAHVPEMDGEAARTAGQQLVDRHEGSLTIGLSR